MPKDRISFKKTGYFSKLICDYLDEKPSLGEFYNRYPNIENFKAQIKEKKKSYTKDTRAILVGALRSQYNTIKTSNETLKNIELLSQDTTYTITTGHQLNLFSGPLYFLYKIISAINLSEQLGKEYPEYNFVPVYWMASEDHDFEEINYFNFNGKKLKWNRKASGAVGELDLKGLEAVCNLFSQELGLGENADKLRHLFKSAYLNNDSLAAATLHLANELFSKYGLVVIDANKKSLKTLFIPYVKEEVFEYKSFSEVSKTSKALESLSKDYKIQVNPRKINLFYITKNLRERIVFINNNYSVLNTDIIWSEKELLEELSSNPERFSPNVILRPLYQEVILPNLCYIGGGGELAYWFQLKQNFKENTVPFPILLLRNSVLIKTNHQSNKLKKLNLSNEDLFLKKEALINKKVRQVSNIDIDFSNKITYLKEQFKSLYELANKTDHSFLGAVAAQERKQIKGLEYLEKRLLTAQKRKLKDHVIRVTKLQSELFPNGSLQERNINFSQLYLEFGEQLIKELKNELEPLKKDFSIITL